MGQKKSIEIHTLIKNLNLKLHFSSLLFYKRSNKEVEFKLHNQPSRIRNQNIKIHLPPS